MADNLSESSAAAKTTGKHSPSQFLKSDHDEQMFEDLNVVETKAILQSLDGQYFLVDICANLTNKKFARDVDSVVQRSKDAGVKKIIVSSSSIQSSKEALRLTRIFPSYIYCTAGVHPHDAKSWTENTITALKEILMNQECVALGQCGLDYTKNFSEPNEQKEVFRKQVELSCDLQKPLLVYERSAHEDLVEILSSCSGKLPTIVLHSFAGNVDQLEKYLSMGFYIGLSGYVWKDKSEDGIKKILEEKLIPLDRLLVETDSPFMYPNTRANQVPSDIKNLLTEKSLSFLHRYCTFQRNEPCSLPVTIEMIAGYYKTVPDEIALKTTYSALKIFGLD